MTPGGFEVKWLPGRGALAYLGEPSTPAAWAGHWDRTQGDVAAAHAFCRTDRLVAALVRRALPSPGDRILEAGCGTAGHVAALRERGVRAAGIDWSAATLSRARAAAPGLPLCAADVRALPFRDGAFGLVLSFGVIEHIPEGIAGAMREAARVLRSGGRLAVTFPAMNLLRRRKARRGRYPAAAVADPARLYQYVLPVAEVVAAARDAGLIPLSVRWRNGLKGTREECPALRHWIDPLVDSRSRNLFLRAGKHLLDLLLAPLAGHMAEVVLERR